ncbi:hypothetical protein IEQ34_007837 [Dendrobium chrysotoxum]|uniref:Uncharacterized protein n=1 Tax=Dendrobium chrysotoxum TaxID=161865 RepID=A0AAV7H4X7_DENCH|nr:hypothetical protein IEQ34_007837 [Dendrobium chrysotoxum]
MSSLEYSFEGADLIGEEQDRIFEVAGEWKNEKEWLHQFSLEAIVRPKLKKLEYIERALNEDYDWRNPPQNSGRKSMGNLLK